MLFLLFDLMLYVHGKQLRSCWDDQLLNLTVPGQSNRRQFIMPPTLKKLTVPGQSNRRRFIMPPTLKKLMGHIAFGAWVRGSHFLYLL